MPPWSRRRDAARRRCASSPPTRRAHAPLRHRGRGDPRRLRRRLGRRRVPRPSRPAGSPAGCRPRPATPCAGVLGHPRRRRRGSPGGGADLASPGADGGFDARRPARRHVRRRRSGEEPSRDPDRQTVVLDAERPRAVGRAREAVSPSCRHRAPAGRHAPGRRVGRAEPAGEDARPGPDRRRGRVLASPSSLRRAPTRSRRAPAAAGSGASTASTSRRARAAAACDVATGDRALAVTVTGPGGGPSTDGERAVSVDGTSTPRSRGAPTAPAGRDSASRPGRRAVGRRRRAWRRARDADPGAGATTVAVALGEAPRSRDRSPSAARPAGGAARSSARARRGERTPSRPTATATTRWPGLAAGTHDVWLVGARRRAPARRRRRASARARRRPSSADARHRRGGVGVAVKLPDGSPAVDALRAPSATRPRARGCWRTPPRPPARRSSARCPAGAYDVEVKRPGAAAVVQPLTLRPRRPPRQRRLIVGGTEVIPRPAVDRPLPPPPRSRSAACRSPASTPGTRAASTSATSPSRTRSRATRRSGCSTG